MNSIFRKTKLVGIVIWASLLAGNLEAGSSLVSFTVSSFDSSSVETAVSGSILVEMDDATKKILAIEEVSLSINGHSFVPSELGFEEYQDFNIIGGQGEGLGSVSGISHGSPHDFWILWNRNTESPLEFTFTGSTNEIHTSQQFDVFTISVNAE